MSNTICSRGGLIQRDLADMARATDPEALLVDAMAGPLFREELHAIDALIAGQGIGIASDVLVARELAAGELVKVLDLSLPGLGFRARCG